MVRCCILHLALHKNLLKICSFASGCRKIPFSSLAQKIARLALHVHIKVRRFAFAHGEIEAVGIASFAHGEVKAVGVATFATHGEVEAVGVATFSHGEIKPVGVSGLEVTGF